MRVLVLLIVLLTNALPVLAQNPRAIAKMNDAARALQQKNVEGAIEALIEAQAYEPNWYEPHVVMAQLLFEKKNYGAATKEMETVLLKPLPFPAKNKADYWARLGKYRYFNSQPDDAAKALDNALKADPKLHEAEFYLALSLQRKDNVAGAQEHIQKALELAPGNISYKVARGRILYDSGKLDEAAKDAREVVDKLSGTPNSEDYTKAKELLTRIEADLGGRKWKQMAMLVAIGVVVIVVGVGAFLGLRAGRGAKGGRALDVASEGLEGSSYDEIAAMALRRLSAMTQMTHGVMYVSTLDGDEMVPKATLALEPDEVKPMPMDVNELPRWVERNDGKPYLFKAEKKEGVFIKAFPDARELLEPLQIRIGVPFLFQERMLGMAFLGVEESKDILRLKKLYDRSQGDIYRVSLECAASLFRLYEDELAYVDVLTKFKSRRYVEENLPRALVNAEDAGRKGAVIMFEFDQFRGLQEQYGDSQAESVLKSVAAEVKAAIPPDDGIIARFEGGKFFAFAPAADMDDALRLAERIRQRVAETRISRNFPSPTCSVGLALFPDNGKKADDLIWTADRVMMGIGAGGGNSIGTADGSSPVPSADPSQTIRVAAPSVASAPMATRTEERPAPSRAPFMPGRPGTPGAGKPLTPQTSGSGTEGTSAPAPPPPPKTGFVPGFSGGPLRPSPAANAASTPAASESPSQSERPASTPAAGIPGFSGGGSGLLRGPSAAPPGTPAAAPTGLGGSKGGGIPGFSGGGPRPQAPAESPEPSADTPAPPAPPRAGGGIPGLSGAPVPFGAAPKSTGVPGFGPPKSPFGGIRKTDPDASPPPGAPKADGAAVPGAPPKAPPARTDESSAMPSTQSAPPLPGAPAKPVFPGAPTGAAFPGAPKGAAFPGAPARSPFQSTPSTAQKGVDSAARIPGFGGSPPPRSEDQDAPRPPMDGPTVPWGRPAAPPPVKDVPPPVKAAPEVGLEPTGELKARPAPPPWVQAEIMEAPEIAATDAATPGGPKSRLLGSQTMPGGLTKGGAPPASKLFKRPDEGQNPSAFEAPAAAAATRAEASPAPFEIKSEERDATGFVGADVLTRGLGHEIDRSAASRESCSVLYFTLDRKDEISSSVGADRMSSIESEVASLVNDFLKEGTDIPGRWQDGFAIVLPRTSARIAWNLAEQIRFTVSNLSFPGVQGNSTLSIGIAAFPEHGQGAEDLLGFSRQAAASAQSDGGNVIKVFGS